MSGKILHILSQRPSRTGSGITLDSLVRLAQSHGWFQAAVVGVPVEDHQIQVGNLEPHNIHPLFFSGSELESRTPDLDFPVPGMSDVMPYPSSIWSTLGPTQLASYRDVWQRHLERVMQTFEPDIIHTNHIWLLSSLIKDIAPDLPVVTTCHATGLRQLALCPDLAAEVIAGCRRNDHFLVLRQDHATLLAETLVVPGRRISVSGVGFRDDVFPAPGSQTEEKRKDLLFVGKFSRAKGLPWLLDAFEALSGQMPNLRLHVAGDGAGPEAELLRSRMEKLGPKVIMHGMLTQKALARLMGKTLVCILPSFYEGVPLVLVEAAACGCRLVATKLPGIQEQIAPHLGSTLKMIPPPRLIHEDEPIDEDLPRFTEDLKAALVASIQNPDQHPLNLDSFTWSAVFHRVETVWKSLLDSKGL